MKHYLLILTLCGSVAAQDYCSEEELERLERRQRAVAERQAEIEEQQEEILRRQRQAEIEETQRHTERTLDRWNTRITGGNR